MIYILQKHFVGKPKHLDSKGQNPTGPITFLKKVGNLAFEVKCN